MALEAARGDGWFKIGHDLIGKAPRQDWEIVRSKFRRGRTGYEGYGLVVRPK